MLNCNSVLMVGVGGVSMHQLALCFKKCGLTVLGYDAKHSAYTDIIERAGIPVTTCFKRDFLAVDCCVKTAAIKDDNKYVVALKKLGIKILDRAEAVGEIAKKFKCVIAVAGTHGKSTTSTLIYEILREAGKSVSCHIGADVFAPRFEIGDDFLVVEACEYNKSFLSLHPNISVVTNVEAEHMDSYKTLFNLRLAFKTFLNRAQIRFVFKEKSTSFLRGSKVKFVENLMDCQKNLEKTAKNDKFSGFLAKLKPKLKGEYNLKNISLAVAVCRFLGIDEKSILKVVNSFAGLPRRYDFIGTSLGRKVYIDYAHHPTEVKAFVGAFLSENRQAQIVFQPHTYSRTKMLLKEFLDVLKNVENLIIYKEYPAREKPSAGMSAHELYLALKPLNETVKFCANFKSVVENLLPNTPIAFVGAGDINLLAHKLVEKNLSF